MTAPARQARLALLKEGYYGDVKIESGDLRERAFVFRQLREERRGLLQDLLSVGDQLQNLDDLIEQLYDLVLPGASSGGPTDDQKVRFLRSLSSVNWLEYFQVPEEIDEEVQRKRRREGDPLLQ